MKRACLFFTWMLSIVFACCGTLTGTVAVWHVLALSVCLGLVNAFDITVTSGGG
jgi:hypothetical protein